MKEKTDKQQKIIRIPIRDWNLIQSPHGEFRFCVRRDQIIRLVDYNPARFFVPREATPPVALEAFRSVDDLLAKLAKRAYECYRYAIRDASNSFMFNGGWCIPCRLDAFGGYAVEFEYFAEPAKEEDAPKGYNETWLSMSQTE